MSFESINIIVNAILLLLSFIIVIWMMQAGAKYAYNYGDTPVRDRLQWIMLRLLVALVFIGLVASIFNIVAPYFTG
ncbi:MAG: hypothetical protein Q8P73_00760 [bacterium]|nr:hypothetical protein [bacterium]